MTKRYFTLTFINPLYDFRQEYEGGDILRKLQDGEIEREKVKDVVTNFASLGLKSSNVSEDDQSNSSDYMTSGASWSSDSDVEVR